MYGLPRLLKRKASQESRGLYRSKERTKSLSMPHGFKVWYSRTDQGAIVRFSQTFGHTVYMVQMIIKLPLTTQLFL